MGTLIAGLDSLTITEPIFKDVKYYLSGDVPEKISELLRAGGAEQTKYFTDFVSHLICGPNATESDLTEASDLYEIPAVTFQWVITCVKQRKLVNTKAYNPSENQIFSNVVACVCQVSPKDVKTLYALITYYGGSVQIKLNSKCTHLIVGAACGTKYNVALNIPPEKLKIVTPDWVTESIKAKIQCPHDAYHPKLLKIPTPPPPPAVSTPLSFQPAEPRISAITGFDFEEGIAKSEVPTQNVSDSKEVDKTQALLDILKQRMPWNHPASSSNDNVSTSSPGLSTMANSPVNNTPRMPMHPNIPNQSIQRGNGPGTPQYAQKLQQLIQNQRNLQQGVVTSTSNTPDGQQQPQQQTMSAMQIQQQRSFQQQQLRIQMLQMQRNQENQKNMHLQQGLIGQQNQNQPMTQQSQAMAQQNHLMAQQMQAMNQQNQQNKAMSQQNQLINQQNQSLAQQSQSIAQQNQPLGQQNQSMVQQNQSVSQQQNQPLGQPISQQQNQVLAQQNQIMSQQNQIMGQQNQPMNQQNQSMNQQNQPMSQQNQSMGPQNQSMGPQNQSMGPQNQSMGPQNQSLGPQNQSLGPQNQSLGPQNQSMGPQNQSIVQQNMGQQNQGLIQQNQLMNQQNQILGQQNQSMVQQTQQPNQQNQSIGQQNQINQQNQLINQQNQSIAQRNQLMGQTDQVIGQQSQAMGQQNQSVGQQTQPMSQQNQPMGQQNQPMGQQNQPMGQQNQPLSQQSQAIGQQNLNMGQQNQNMGQPGQHMLQLQQNQQQQIPQSIAQSIAQQIQGVNTSVSSTMNQMLSGNLIQRQNINSQQQQHLTMSQKQAILSQQQNLLNNQGQNTVVNREQLINNQNVAMNQLNNQGQNVGQQHNILSMPQQQGQQTFAAANNQQQQQQNQNAPQQQQGNINQQTHLMNQQQPNQVLGINQQQTLGIIKQQQQQQQSNQQGAQQILSQSSNIITNQRNLANASQQVQIQNIAEHLLQSTLNLQQNSNSPMQQQQQNWRQTNQQQQQNLHLVQQGGPQGAMPGQQIIRGQMLQQRTPILQQQIIQNQNILNNPQQQQGQHNLLNQQNQQIIQQQPAGQHIQTVQGGQQVLVQKQLQQGGQQQIMINQSQLGNQQILVQGNQQIALQNAQTIPSHGNTQIISQGGQIISSHGPQIISQDQQLIQSNQIAERQIIGQGGQGGQQIILQGGQQVLSQGGQIIGSQGGQQIISQGSQQVGQQILQHGGQQIIPQGGQQIISSQQGGQQIIASPSGQQQTVGQGQQILSQGGQIISSQGGQQIIAHGQQIVQQGQQPLPQGCKQIITQGGQQILTQGGQQIIAQGNQLNQGQPGQQIIQGQTMIQQPGGQTQQVITHQGGQQIIAQAGGQQIIAQGQQIITQGGQQIIQTSGGQMVQQPGQQMIWQQQQFFQQRQSQIIAGPPGTVGQRVSWGTGPGRQLIHLDAQTHAQLKQMDPQQRAQFVAQLQKRRQLTVQRTAQQHQVTLVRPQQVQWVQQQGARVAVPTGDTSVVVPQSPSPQVQGAPQQPPPPPPHPQVQQQQAAAQQQQQQRQQQQQQYAQLQLQRQQQFAQLQRLQAQKEHAQKQAQAIQNPGVGIVAGAVVPGRPDSVAPQPEGTIVGPATDQVGNVMAGGNTLVVNSRTKTALANMLSIRLQGTQPTPGGEVVTQEPSAAGTLRLMTAAHNAPPRAPGEVVQSLQQRRMPPGAIHHQLSYGRPPPPSSVPPSPSPAVPPPPPPPRAQFYGHNPNLKLPAHYFLLGCIFHVVEYGTHLAQEWERAVWRHGGEVEKGYSARVTHVLAMTQKHGVVMQALRDVKRCVTAYWLSDTMLRRQVAPPWQALHLPLMYAAHDKPAGRHRACISGFSGEERQRIKAMIEHTGAKVTTYMTRDNTVLVCRRQDGAKHNKAVEWGIPVVSAQWVTDLLLGNMSALSQIENPKYQQFTAANPFRMEYSLVPHLMNAWKMPINITQESHERVRRGILPAPPPRRAPKRPRAPTPPPTPTHIVLEKPLPDNAPRVAFSSVRDVEPYAQIVKNLGGFVVAQTTDATHLVMSKLVRTPKLISCLVTAKFILPTNWLAESNKMGKFADETKFTITSEQFREVYKCDIPKILAVGDERRKLFDGITFYMTPSVQPSRVQLTEIIELCGGKVDKFRKSFDKINEMHKEKPNSYLVLTVPSDLHLVYYLLQTEKNLNIVCNTELVFSSIMQMKMDVSEYLVKVD